MSTQAATAAGPGTALVHDRTSARAVCLATLARGSKSFALAGRLLPRAARADAAALYAWCRRVDDAIDDVPAAAQPAALASLGAELDALERGQVPADLTLRALAEVVAERHLPLAYPRELLDGMAMDVAGTRYLTVDELLLYCHRVAGVVGLMMAHVLGVSDAGAVRPAAHLGLAMQLTNICRDVDEDWRLGRLYLPADLLARAGAGELPAPGTAPIPASAHPAIRRVVAELLALADGFYRSGARGTRALPARAALAILGARHIYAAIGGGLARRGHDPLRGRVVVSTGRKLLLLGRAGLGLTTQLPSRLFRPRRLLPPAAIPTSRFPDDILPL